LKKGLKVKFSKDESDYKMILDEIKLQGLGFILSVDFDKVQTEYFFLLHVVPNQIWVPYQRKVCAHPTKFASFPHLVPLFMEVSYKNLVPVNAVPGDVPNQNVSAFDCDDTRTTVEEAKDASTAREVEKSTSVK
jgi:hypothetical protein